MTGWTRDELAKIGTAQELQIASLRRDGSLRNPRTIWVVCVGDDLYVRSHTRARRRLVPRHPGTPPRPHPRRRRRQGHHLRRRRPDLNDQIDAANRDKYRRYRPSTIGGVVNPEARAATIQLVPRSTAS
jgi:hypothetical protein